MKWKRGLLRLWSVGALVWVGLWLSIGGITGDVISRIELIQLSDPKPWEVYSYCPGLPQPRVGDFVSGHDLYDQCAKEISARLSHPCLPHSVCPSWL